MAFEDFLKDLRDKRCGFINPIAADPKVLMDKETIERYLGTFEETKPEEKWIWVEGYKGTDKDMKCRGFQYELGKQFDIPEGAVVIPCQYGFHLCPRLDQVFGYYGVGNGNRFFKVRALVREKDWHPSTAGKEKPFVYIRNDDKASAKSIIFEREMTVDEILTAKDVDFSEWTEEDKLQALDKGTHYVTDNYRIKHLVKAGYSEAFASYLIQEGYYKDALAVASQPDLSMDMRVAMLIAHHRDYSEVRYAI